jgi:hypothetical protein
MVFRTWLMSGLLPRRVGDGGPDAKERGVLRRSGSELAVSAERNSPVSDAMELEAKMAFDRVFVNLAAQRIDLQQLQGRAKDLIGLITLAASFLAAFGKDAVGSVLPDLAHQPPWFLWLFLALPAVTLLASLYVLIPRSHWVFDVNAESVKRNMDNRPDAQRFRDPTEFYLWYVVELSPFLEQNTKPLRTRKWAIWCSAASLVASVAMIGYLVASTI